MDFSSLVCELDNDASASFVYHRVVQLEGVLQKPFMKNQWNDSILSASRTFLTVAKFPRSQRANSSWEIAIPHLSIGTSYGMSTITLVKH